MTTQQQNNLIRSSLLLKTTGNLSKKELEILERIFTIYRSIIIMLYNYAQSGHPGGSISMGRIVLNILLNKNSKFDISNLNREDSDVIGLAAGHKVLGWYSLLGIIFDIIKLKDEKFYNSIPVENKIRLEDLLGFRKNPVVQLPLIKKFNSRFLDGHPNTDTPGVFLTTGASGVGFGIYAGFAFAKKEFFEEPPIVNVIEGEGGLTAGRVSENLAHLYAARVWNFISHIDWNNASIDSDNVCSDEYCNTKGEYVNWQPYELGLLHGHNTVYVEDGRNFDHINSAQQYIYNTATKNKDVPSMIVYRTLKGECYLEGKKSHGSGYKFESEEYFKSQEHLEKLYNIKFLKVPSNATNEDKEEYLYKNLLLIEQTIKNDTPVIEYVFNNLISSRDRLNKSNRSKKNNSANVSLLFSKEISFKETPKQFIIESGKKIALREIVGKILGHLNSITKGGFYGISADVVGSTAINFLSNGFSEGFINEKNFQGKILASGICEDGLSSITCGISASGHYIGVGSSYATFMSPMSFTAVRLYAISHQSKKNKNLLPAIFVNTHSGIKTGEDGPTHACPQSLSMWKSFSKLNTKVITLTPFDANELWPLIVFALKQKPAAIIIFVPRIAEVVIDRKTFGFPSVRETVNGIYYLRKTRKTKKTIIYQGADVVAELPTVLQEIDKEKIELNILYISSSELFSILPKEKQEEILPEEIKKNAMAITGFTIDTMYEYITSEKGRKFSLHPFNKGNFLGSGNGDDIIKQAGLDAKSQLNAIKNFLCE